MNLIVQAVHDIPAAQLQHIATLTGATRTEQVAPHLYRLCDAQPHEGLAAYCLEHRLDYGYVEPGRTLGDFGLLVMDMDSTLISIECIDEIADMQGLKPQVAEITEAAMRGEIEFAESLRRRVALLEGLEESAVGRRPRRAPARQARTSGPADRDRRRSRLPLHRLARRWSVNPRAARGSDPRRLRAAPAASTPASPR